MNGIIKSKTFIFFRLNIQKFGLKTKPVLVLHSNTYVQINVDILPSNRFLYIEKRSSVSTQDLDSGFRQNDTIIRWVKLLQNKFRDLKVNSMGNSVTNSL